MRSKEVSERVASFRKALQREACRQAGREVVISESGICGRCLKNVYQYPAITGPAFFTKPIDMCPWCRVKLTVTKGSKKVRQVSIFEI